MLSFSRGPRKVDFLRYYIALCNWESCLFSETCCTDLACKVSLPYTVPTNLGRLCICRFSWRSLLVFHCYKVSEFLQFLTFLLDFWESAMNSEVHVPQGWFTVSTNHLKTWLRDYSHSTVSQQWWLLTKRERFSARTLKAVCNGFRRNGSPVASLFNWLLCTLSICYITRMTGESDQPCSEVQCGSVHWNKDPKILDWRQFVLACWYFGRCIANTAGST